MKRIIYFTCFFISSFFFHNLNAFSSVVFPSLTITNVIPESCPNASDGSFTIVGTGGSEVFDFSKDGNSFVTGINASTYTFSGLTSGVYNAKIRDVNTGDITNATVVEIENNDTEPPTVVTKDFDLYFSGATGTLSPSDIDGGTSDNCGVASLFASPNGFSCFASGQTFNVRLIAKDFAGNQSESIAVVRVFEIGSPDLTCPGNQIISLDASCTASLPDLTGLASAFDHCGTPNNGGRPELIQSPGAGTLISSVEEFDVTITARDINGNVSSCNFSVSVEGEDTDGDGIPNCNDLDDDGDSQSDVDEMTCGSDPLDELSLSADNDIDNYPDCVDIDDDNDGITDAIDNCPFDANMGQGDSDLDGIGDLCDPIFNIDLVVANAIQYIEEILNLNKGQENVLGNGLSKVLEKYCDGGLLESINNLNAFANQVNAFMQGGMISSEEGEVLLQVVATLLEAINNVDIYIECPLELRSNVSISDELDLSFQIFPNPAKDILNVEIMGGYQGRLDFQIYDNFGRMVYTRVVNATGHSFALNLQSQQLTSGLYFINVSYQDKVETKRLFVVN